MAIGNKHTECYYDWMLKTSEFKIDFSGLNLGKIRFLPQISGKLRKLWLDGIFDIAWFGKDGKLSCNYFWSVKCSPNRLTGQLLTQNMEDRVQDNFTNRSDESLESLKHPQQEIGGHKISSDSELLRSIVDNPEALAVLHQKFKELEKPEGQSNWKTHLHNVFQSLRVRATSPWVKAVLFFFWTRLLHVFNMVSEIWKEKRTKLSEVQRNLKAVNETHEKVRENVEEVEDQVKPCCLNFCQLLYWFPCEKLNLES